MSISKPTWLNAENLVAELLIKQGWQILARNFRALGCEIDIAAVKQQTLAIVEVKARPRMPKTLTEGASLISRRKRSALKRGADALIDRRSLQPKTIRFDLAIVTTHSTKSPRITYYAQAFTE